MTQDELSTPRSDRPTRRGVIVAGAAASAAMAVAGCTTYRPETGSEQSDGSTPSSSTTEGAGGGTALGTASDVPVGGGKVFAAQRVVVTQPRAGTFKAYSAVCTHQGCSVDEIVDGSINCPCHGSKFSAADGSVTAGPAKRPLATKQVINDGGTLRLA